MKHKFTFSFFLSVAWLTYFHSSEARDIPFLLPTPSIDSFLTSSSINTLGEQTNLQGQIQSNSINMTLKDYKDIYALFQISSNGEKRCRYNILSLEATQGPIVFIGNSTSNTGGAIYADTRLKITDSQEIILFANNLARASFVRNIFDYPIFSGAVYARYVDITHNKQPVYFVKNIAASEGGAIFTSIDVLLADNQSACFFCDNAVTLTDQNRCKGGALRLERFNCLNNRGSVVFANNLAGEGGGISAIHHCSFSGNLGNIIFKNNKALRRSGGAMHSPTITLENNPGIISFHNNSSAVQGGACLCTNFTLRNNNHVYFTNNSSPQGGALFTNSNSQVRISADKGHVIFNNNCLLDTNREYRNSITLGNNANVQFGAKKNFCVLFYDPIQHENSTTHNLIINPSTEDLGCVVFSGAKVNGSPKTENNLFSRTNNATESNLFSRSKNTIELQNGVLAIEDQAGVSTYKFQQTGGTLCLGNGGTLAAREKAANAKDAALTINNLGIILPQQLQHNAQAPKIWVYPSANNNTFTENTQATVTLSGNLTLTNEEGDNPYDDVDLSKNTQRVPLLYLCDNTDKKINITNLNIEAINAQSHYGHQGIWSPYWEEHTTQTNPASALTANTSHKTLYADWTSTGYIPNPKYQTALVANVLWETVYTMLSGILPPEHSDQITNIYGKALGIIANQRSHAKKPGFRMQSRGYSVGTSAKTQTHHKISFGFVQSFAHLKEKGSENKAASKNYLGTLQFHIPWLYDRILTSASLAYNYAPHEIKHIATDQTSQGTFSSHTWGLSITHAFPFTHPYITLIPFIEAHAIKASLTSFKETGKFPRKFATKSALYNLSMPLGITGQWHNTFHLPTTWNLKIAYQPVVYRYYPKILTTLLASNGSWLSSGTPVDRHSFSLRVANSVWLFSKLQMSFAYQGDLSSSTFCNYLKAGSTLAF